MHTLLDLLTLFSTIYAIMFIKKNLMGTYSKADDSMNLTYLLGPCALLAVLVNPRGNRLWFNRVSLITRFCPLHTWIKSHVKGFLKIQPTTHSVTPFI